MKLCFDATVIDSEQKESVTWVIGGNVYQLPDISGPEKESKLKAQFQEAMKAIKQAFDEGFKERCFIVKEGVVYQRHWTNTVADKVKGPLAKTVKRGIAEAKKEARIILVGMEKP